MLLPGLHARAVTLTMMNDWRGTQYPAHKWQQHVAAAQRTAPCGTQPACSKTLTRVKRGCLRDGDVVAARQAAGASRCAAVAVDALGDRDRQHGARQQRAVHDACTTDAAAQQRHPARAVAAAIHNHAAAPAATAIHGCAAAAVDH